MKLGKVLLVDDSDIDNLVNKKVLDKSGYTEFITVKKSAESALAFLENVEQEKLPNYIFLDIRMPEMDGFDFLREFDKLPTGIKHTINIVMLSSSIDEDDVSKAKANPYVIKYLNKPLTKDKLDNLPDA